MDDFFKNNPLLKNMDEEKINFILNFAQKKKPQNMKEAMPFLLANMKLAKNQNITFDKPEIELIAQILTKDLPEAEKKQVQKILSML